MEKIDFDSMSLVELWEYRNVNLIQLPMLAALITSDVVRQKQGNIPEDELIKVPTGRSSFTTYTKEFETQFRDAIKGFCQFPDSRQTFEALRKRILVMSFQELVEWNGLQNLLSTEARDALYERENVRVLNNIPQTECIRRGHIVAVNWSKEHVADLRATLISAIDQKEKDFANERSS